jgi:Na+-driven multidrug efflux pump
MQNAEITHDDGLPPTDSIIASVSAKEQSPLDCLSYRQHLMDLSKSTYPIILTDVFQNSLPVVDVAFVGNLGKDALAAAALATVWFDLWHASMLGIQTATDTFLSQCYGANQLDNYAIWTGNSLVITIFTTILMSGAMALCAPCMKLFGQDSDLADAAGEFSYRLIPGFFPLSFVQGADEVFANSEFTRTRCMDWRACQCNQCIVQLGTDIWRGGGGTCGCTMGNVVD